MPRMRSCDELTCYYSPGHPYEIRNLRCRLSGADTAICRYQRGDILAVHIPTLSEQNSAAPAPATPYWTDAESRFRRFNGVWVLESDDR